MRLINAETLEFFSVVDPSSVRYAILSHTWSQVRDEELTYQDMSTDWTTASPSAIAAIKQKPGYAKLLETCRLAKEKKLDYVWIDTCCIDKSSSAELSEAINSMFAWYEQSTVCFAQLSDLSPGTGLTAEDLEKCRWLTRGWTLQELIAPSVLEIYDAVWAFRGTKLEHSWAISQASGIAPRGFLNFKFDPWKLNIHREFSVADRMFWASRRETTRPEDMAYCLFGIFDVSMPLLYGEGGTKAYIRLQRAVLEATQDLSLLAWQFPEPVKHDSPALARGVLAPSPRAFDYDLMNLFRTDKSFHRTGLLGNSAQMDGPLIRLKRPRLSRLVGTGDRIFLDTGITFWLKRDNRINGCEGAYTLWIPIVQFGVQFGVQFSSLYGRLYAAMGPELAELTMARCAAFEEARLLSNPNETDGASSTGMMSLHTDLPKNKIISMLDAAPKESWNRLTETFSMGLFAEDVGYLRIRVRRIQDETDQQHSFKNGAWYIPTWLDRVCFLVPWSRLLQQNQEDRMCLAMIIRRHDDSPPTEWFPFIRSRDWPTHFDDEESILDLARGYVYRTARKPRNQIVYVGHCTAGEAVRCHATIVRGRSWHCHELRFAIVDMTWVDAVEESKKNGRACLDFSGDLPVDVNEPKLVGPVGPGAP